MDCSNGNSAGKRGALSFYCTCTQRPHARRTRFSSSIVCASYRRSRHRFRYPEPMPASMIAALRIYDRFSSNYSCGAGAGGVGGAGAGGASPPIPPPPIAPLRRSRILACISSTFACWSGVSTARTLVMFSSRIAIPCARRSSGANAVFARSASIFAWLSAMIALIFAIWSAFRPSCCCIMSMWCCWSIPPCPPIPIGGPCCCPAAGGGGASCWATAALTTRPALHSSTAAARNIFIFITLFIRNPLSSRKIPSHHRRASLFRYRL
jgi:hypothetical protein